MRHSLRYYRHSGLVIYKSKLPAPSVSMPCDYRILQSPTKEQVELVLWETVHRSHFIAPLIRKNLGYHLLIGDSPDLISLF